MSPVLSPAIRDSEDATPSWAWNPLISIWLGEVRFVADALAACGESSGTKKSLPSVRTPSTSKIEKFDFAGAGLSGKFGHRGKF
jgi:hypothetical protein